ncbi:MULTISPECIES: hypothetical protein [Methanosarcina]|nr:MULTISPECIES: hypothetical protein [Methanosarcina]
MLEDREKLILAILLAIGIVLIITNTASAYYSLPGPPVTWNDSVCMI